MRWIDLHCDTLSVLLKLGKSEENLYSNRQCVDISRLQETEAQAVFFACFVNAAEYGDPACSRTWQTAYTDVKKMIRMAQLAEHGELVENMPQIILTVEEGGVLDGHMGRLEELYRDGVRLLTLTWNYENCIGSPNSTDVSVMKQGLKPFGIEVVERMNELGMIVDVSHLSDGGFWDCVRYSKAPVIATHSNARTLCPHPRNLSDEMLRALGEKGGVAGVNFYAPFLKKTVRYSDDIRRKELPSVRDIARHIRWIIKCAGEDAAAIGTDLDGFGPDGMPQGIRGIQDVGKLWDALKKEGLSERQIEKTAEGNVRRLMRETMRKTSFLF